MSNSDNLPHIFAKLLKLYEETENSILSSNSLEYQSLVNEGSTLSEKGIDMVNTLDLFSSNEGFDELSTNSICYLLLPAFFAYFSTRKSTQNRLDAVKLAESCYNDFYKLCTNYKVPGIPDKPSLSLDQLSLKSSNKDINAMNEERSRNIQAYKAQQDLDVRLSELKAYVDQEHVDDEVKREFYLKMIQKWAYFVCTELKLISEELPLLEMMLRGGPSKEQDKSKSVPAKAPLRPFILTRTSLEAKVFGAGYPSLPTYSIEEYCKMEQDQGILPTPGDSQANGSMSTGKVVRVTDKGVWRRTEVDEREGEEAREAEDDLKEDRDDPELLEKRRQWDAFKDDHRRGEGNRMNRM